MFGSFLNSFDRPFYTNFVNSELKVVDIPWRTGACAQATTAAANQSPPATVLKAVARFAAAS
jgi:hypothetical protein